MAAERITSLLEGVAVSPEERLSGSDLNHGPRERGTNRVAIRMLILAFK